MQPNPDKTRLSEAFCGGISRKTLNPNIPNVKYGISVHIPHGRLGCAISEFYCISVRNELLASGMYIRGSVPICYRLFQWGFHSFMYGLTENKYVASKFINLLIFACLINFFCISLNLPFDKIHICVNFILSSNKPFPSCIG
jgi:hypothetical protein